ncbi:4Fe-4S ferredoxin [archaeon]|nr:MAG: 4Fe-4S ferredoxin [archaeon]RLI19462.1 MAG: 4Fe-4S ferredoxin [Candidatus Bathyarchaeota archaeon]
MRRVCCDETVCIGCHLCEVWCIVAHSKSGDILKAFLYEKERAIARVRVEERGAVSFAVQCRHCEEPECVFACISGALRKDFRKGVVLHDASKCVGCFSCVLACPYGAIIPVEERGKVVKCDLCEGREMPICVEKCPNEALFIQESERE